MIPLWPPLTVSFFRYRGTASIANSSQIEKAHIAARCPRTRDSVLSLSLSLCGVDELAICPLSLLTSVTIERLLLSL